jgi:Ca2+/H+ antiporter
VSQVFVEPVPMVAQDLVMIFPLLASSWWYCRGCGRVGPTPMDPRFWPGAVLMIFDATPIAGIVTANGPSAWLAGLMSLLSYLIFAMTLYLLPPQHL